MLGDYQTQVDALLRDREGVTGPASRDAAIGQGVLRYSTDRPIRDVVDLTAADTHYLALPAGWVTDFSRVLRVEHPIGQHPPAIVPGEDWQHYDTPAGLMILLHVGLAVGAAVRVTYTRPHTVDALTDTIPAIHRDAVASYAAGLLCRELAAYYSGDSDSTIAADTVDHGDQAMRWDKRGRELRQRYYESLGVNPRRNTAAGAVVDLDRQPSYGRTAWTRTRRNA